MPFQKALLGDVNIGRIHVVAASPIHIEGTEDTDFGSLAAEIQRRQQDRMCVSDYHIRAASMALGLSVDTTRRALIAIGLRCLAWLRHPRRVFIL